MPPYICEECLKEVNEIAYCSYIDKCICLNCFIKYQKQDVALQKEGEEIMIVGKKYEVRFFDRKSDPITVGSIGTITNDCTPDNYGLPRAIVDWGEEYGKVYISFNSTSQAAIAAKYGHNSEDWIGKKIKLCKETVENKKTGAIFKNVCIFRPVD